MAKQNFDYPHNGMLFDHKKKSRTHYKWTSKRVNHLAEVAHAFSPSALEQRQADLCEFETSLVYKS